MPRCSQISANERGFSARNGKTLSLCARSTAGAPYTEKTTSQRLRSSRRDFRIEGFFFIALLDGLRRHTVGVMFWLRRKKFSGRAFSQSRGAGKWGRIPRARVRPLVIAEVVTQTVRRQGAASTSIDLGALCQSARVPAPLH